MNAERIDALAEAGRKMAEAAFRYGGLVNWQVQYVKRRDALPMTREAMFAVCPAR